MVPLTVFLVFTMAHVIAGVPKEEGIDCPEKFHGRAAFFEFIELNKEFTAYWYERFKSAYS